MERNQTARPFFLGLILLGLAASETLAQVPADLWWTDYSNAAGWNSSPSYYKTIQFPDLDDDGESDVCARGIGGIWCGLSDGTTFTSATLWLTEFTDAKGWASFEYYWGTIRFPDVTGDGFADVCGRGFDGIYCAQSDGSRFTNFSRWFWLGFGDSEGWNSSPAYWSTIRFVDLNADGKMDICGRDPAADGLIVCGLSNGTSFPSVSSWSNHFSDPEGWDTSASYYSTIQFADVTGDGYPDLCGRGPDGVVCYPNSQPMFQGFFGTAITTSQFSDASGWTAERYYSTIQFANVNGLHNTAEVCGRGSGGIYCGRRTGSIFVEANAVRSPSFSDNNGWGQERFYKTIRLVDVDGDGRADVCGRGNGGIFCATAKNTLSADFNPVTLLVGNFGENFGWGTNPAYWATVQPANVSGGIASEWCGRGGAGIWCGRPTGP